MHYMADVAAGLAFGLLLLHAGAVWAALRNAAERVANSWTEWQIGPLRVINHGFYGGAAGFAAVFIAGTAAGPRASAGIAIAAACAIAGAALWAQWIEGSPRLLRPFGFYGGMLGVALSACVMALAGWDAWLVIAAYCLASPVMQSIGRLRCLVQGCCHGRPAGDARIGIRYTHPRSRVTRIAHLEGVPLHPTPIYSILWNGFVFVVCARLWSVAAPLHMVAGTFAILTGLGRFVEEGYRGEPQTPVRWGLRLYQWVAIGTVIAGAAITALGSSSPAPAPDFSWRAFAIAMLFGAVSNAALGVDFPKSNRMFARLT
jgi:hypothetical protein